MGWGCELIGLCPEHYSWSELEWVESKLNWSLVELKLECNWLSWGWLRIGLDLGASKAGHTQSMIDGVSWSGLSGLSGS